MAKIKRRGTKENVDTKLKNWGHVEGQEMIPLAEDNTSDGTSAIQGDPSSPDEATDS